MRAVNKAYPVMFRAEYVAETDIDSCNGCLACMEACQFDAIRYNPGDEKVRIDPLRCYGCGICRAVCSSEAIELRERDKVAAAANLWQ